MVGMTVFLLTVQLKSDTDHARLAEMVPKIMEQVRDISGGNSSQFFRSTDGILFGLLLESKLKARQIRAILDTAAIFQHEDSFILNEIGEDFAGAGFSTAWSWMQSRLRKD